MDVAKDDFSKTMHDHQNWTKKKKGETEDTNTAVVAEAKTTYEAACKVPEQS